MNNNLPRIARICLAALLLASVTPAVAQDGDGDGVADVNDRCPNTPVGAFVDSEGCAPDSDGDGVIDANDRCPMTMPGARVNLSGCPLQQVLVLKGVEFESGSAELTRTSRTVLQQTADSLRNHPQIRAEITGHTDNVGSAESNVKLSQQRAEAVRDYLVSQGVDASRLGARGYGPEKPIADNNNKQGRALNRRVEIELK